MKKFLIIISLLLQFTVTAQNKQSASNPIPGHLTFTAITSCPEKNTPSKTDLTRIEDCGFNTCSQGGTIASNRQMLSACGQSGKIRLKIPVDYIPVAELGAFVNEIKDNPDVAYWSLKDEPKYKYQVNTAAQMASIIRKYDSRHPIMINLQPNLPSSDWATYDDFYNEVIREVNPDIISVDHYPFSQPYLNGPINLSSSYYKTLEYYSAKSKQSGRPFYSIIQSVSMEAKLSSDNSLFRPEPSFGTIRFQTIAALAYGAKGISFWTYAQRNDTNSEHYFSAPINLQNEKTPVWDMCQTVLSEIKRVETVFLNSEHIATYHTNPAANQYVKPLPYSGFPLQKVNSGPEGVMIGHLKSGKTNYMVVINPDPSHSQTVTLSFDRLMTKYTGPLPPPGPITKAALNSETLTLPEGGFVIYVWQS